MSGTTTLRDIEEQFSALDAFQESFNRHFGPQRNADLLTETEAAAIFGCSTDTIQSFAALGILTPTRLSGNSRYYSRVEINRKFANGGNHEKATGNGGMQDRSR